MIKAKDITNIHHIPERKICTSLTTDYCYDDKWIAFLVPKNSKNEDEAHEYFAGHCAELDDQWNTETGKTEEEAILKLIKRQINRPKGLSLITSVDG
ncbi:MAG: hypothetical protein GY714_23245 [Desulfobacterales bacterium]|nr:hypothetical protein [Desulfobacterales bacterium]